MLKVGCGQQAVQVVLENVLERSDPEGSSRGVVLPAAKDLIDVKYKLAHICYDIAIECNKHKQKGTASSLCGPQSMDRECPEVLDSFLHTIKGQVRKTVSVHKIYSRIITLPISENLEIYIFYSFKGWEIFCSRRTFSAIVDVYYPYCNV